MGSAPILGQMADSVFGAVLAAGISSRLGRPKQLVVSGGETLVHRTARVAREVPMAQVAVVTGASGDLVRAAVADLDVTMLENAAWPEGMASSIRCAAAWAEEQGAAGLLLLVCDQPRLSATHLAALLAEHARTGAIVGSAYGGVVGVPAVFPRSELAALGALRGDRGARALLHGAASIAWEDGAVDVDAPGDLASLPS